MLTRALARGGEKVETEDGDEDKRLKSAALPAPGIGDARQGLFSMGSAWEIYSGAVV